MTVNEINDSPQMESFEMLRLRPRKTDHYLVLFLSIIGVQDGIEPRVTRHGADLITRYFISPRNTLPSPEQGTE